MFKKLVVIFFFTLVCTSANARPVSYPGGFMFMTMNDAERKTAAIDYTVTPKYAFGVRSDFMSGDEEQMHHLTFNALLKRWNNYDSQGNIFLMSGAGFAENDGETDPSAFIGMEADWEDRRFYVLYQNEAMHSADIDKSFEQMARVGIAPYIGNYGDLHTWLMLQVNHYPGGDKRGDNFTVTPLVRMFKGEYLGELGMNNNGEALFNFTILF